MTPISVSPPAPHRRPSGHTRFALACAGLLLAAVVVGCGKSSAGSGQVAATVNKGEVSIHQVNLVLQQQSRLKPEQVDEASRVILDRLIDQEVLVQQAESLKLDRDPRVMQQIDAARREVLARAVAERTAQAAGQPTDDDIRAYFDAKPVLYKERRVYSLEEIQVRAQGAELDALRERVQGTKNLADLGRYIKDQGLSAQVNQRTAPAEALPLPLVTQLAAIRDGQGVYMVEPAGARIVIRLGAKDAGVTLDQARPTIEAQLAAERRQKAVESDIRALRQAAKVEKMGKFALASAAPSTTTAGTASNVAAAPAPAAAASADASTGHVEGATRDLTKQSLNKGLNGLQ